MGKDLGLKGYAETPAEAPKTLVQSPARTGVGVGAVCVMMMQRDSHA